jgi:predicted lysophospholipase L1 biosynthesis ABC-type transport system permease subunit
MSELHSTPRAATLRTADAVLFLGLPGVVLAALLTAALVGAGATRRRNEQALLRTRGLPPRRIWQLAVVEASVVGVAGGLLGLTAALIAERVAFGPASLRTNSAATAIWFSISFVVGLSIAGWLCSCPLGGIFVVSPSWRPGAASARRLTPGGCGPGWT